jgi:sucrose phosphorylase
MPEGRKGDWRGKALDHLSFLYGDRRAPDVLRQLEGAVSRRRGMIRAGHSAELTERDAILIAYPDQVQEPGRKPLQALAHFCRSHVAGLVSGVHLLPFYPSSSDDGFSVKDYRAVDPALGDWDDIAGLSRDFRLMFDAVINHASAQGEWFQKFLHRDPRYGDYFIVIEGNPDLSAVVRPRTSPLLTTVESDAGPLSVWTTFSADQPDLNYSNPDVLLEVLEILLDYAGRGAELVRLDAIGYLWKEAGTPCIHLPQTHRIIQLLRTVLDEAAPHVVLVSETNVAHKENISYFGDGSNEAHLVYNFALPPLVLHAFLRESSRWLHGWAERLVVPGPRTGFLNFLASHDGIGLNPVRGGLLPEEEIEFLIRETQARGGLVSFKDGPGGRRLAYELNINYLDALSPVGSADEDAAALDRFVAAHAILLALRGVPAVYFHSLFGSRGWPEGVRRTGRNRTINRQKLARRQIEDELGDPRSRRARVFRRLAELLKARAALAALAPSAAQEMLDCGDAVLGVLRIAKDQAARALCLHNLSGRSQIVDLTSGLLGDISKERWVDLVGGRGPQREGRLRLELRPHEVRWLAPAKEQEAREARQ